MKKLLILVWCLPASASHIDLTQATKREFVQKRLDMMKSQLALKLKQILSVTKGSAQAERLQQEIVQLKKSIPVTQNSLKALQKTERES